MRLFQFDAVVHTRVGKLEPRRCLWHFESMWKAQSTLESFLALRAFHRHRAFDRNGTLRNNRRQGRNWELSCPIHRIRIYDFSFKLQ